MNKFLKKVLLICMCLSVLASQAEANALSDANHAYDAGDYAKAAKWYQLAAKQGDAYAQLNLGMMYYRGEGVPQVYKESAKWYRMAAEQGNANAQYLLGVMYDNGQGVPQDYTLAYMWVNIAAANAPAGELKQIAASHRDSMAKKMGAQQTAKAQQLARRCTAKIFKGC
jgi:TPR repeat protein